MPVYLGRALIKGFGISDIRCYSEEGKDIAIKKVENPCHEENCWKGWLAWPNWREISISRLLVILSCGHYFTIKCFFTHPYFSPDKTPFQRCPHCNYRIFLEDRKNLCEELFRHIEKIKAGKAIALKKEAMFLLRQLFITFQESNLKRWTDHVCFMFNYHSDCSVPSLLVLERIMQDHPEEKEKIFSLIDWETILDRTKVCIPMIGSVLFFKIHLEFLKKSLLSFYSDEYENNISRLKSLQKEFFQLVNCVEEEYLTEHVRILCKSILEIISDEIERNGFMMRVIVVDDESETNDYNLAKYKDQEYDSDSLPCYA